MPDQQTKIGPLELQVLQLAREVATLRHAVCTLISWIGASAGSPLSINDCRTLIELAEGKHRYDDASPGK